MRYVIDADDFHANNHRMDLLTEIKRTHPNFKITLFAVPALCDGFDLLNHVPDWISLVPHGWEHPTPRECERWGLTKSLHYLSTVQILFPMFERGFKAPGWQISDGMYEALHYMRYWLADQSYNNHRAPVGLRRYLLDDNDPRFIKQHYHIQNVCGNGLEERFEDLMAIPHDAEFEFIRDIV